MLEGELFYVNLQSCKELLWQKSFSKSLSFTKTKFQNLSFSKEVEGCKVCAPQESPQMCPKPAECQVAANKQRNSQQNLPSRERRQISCCSVSSFCLFAHVVFLGAIVMTVATFETAKRGGFKLRLEHKTNGYHTPSRTRHMYYNGKRIKLDPNDPGGEHE